MKLNPDEEKGSRLPLVHAVVVHLHGLAMLNDCLSSLLASTGVHLEIVLVLNDCKEDLPSIVHSYAGIHPVRTPAAMGFSEANNFGVAWAQENIGTPDSYYFLNNDTVSAPEALELQLQALQEEQASVVGPLLVIQGAERHLNSLGLNVTEDAWGWDEGIGLSLEEYGSLPPRREVIAVTGSAFLATASAHQAVGGWTELYGYYFEDIDYCLKVRRMGGKVIHEPSARVLHRISATMSIGSRTKFFLFRRNRLLLAMVHWPIGLLLRLLKRALFEEVLGRPREQTELERRGLLSAIPKIPGALRQRFRNGRKLEWVRFLHPAGSVPAITLPQPYEPPEQNVHGQANFEVSPSPEAEAVEVQAAFDPAPLLSWPSKARRWRSETAEKRSPRSRSRDRSRA